MNGNQQVFLVVFCSFGELVPFTAALVGFWSAPDDSAACWPDGGGTASAQSGTEVLVLEDSSSGVTLKHGRCWRGRTFADLTSMHQRCERSVRSEPAARFQSRVFCHRGGGGMWRRCRVLWKVAKAQTDSVSVKQPNQNPWNPLNVFHVSVDYSIIYICRHTFTVG